MANKIVLKKSSVAGKVPLATDLDIGELAVNLADAKLYSKDASGVVISVGGGGAGSGDVTGPSSATDNAIARFDNTTGKLIQNSLVTIDDNGNAAGVNAVTFDTTPSTPPTTEGTLYWDSADGNQTLSLVMAGGNAVQQIGEEQYYRIKASAPITNGQVVMFTGTVGASGALQGAPATGLTAATASYVMGIATQDMATNDWGYVTAFGLVRSINTSAFTDGAILYLDPTVAGGLTTTVPSAPNPKVQVCACIHAASNGSLFIRPSFGGVLGQYEGDVNISSPLNGQLLIRDQTSGKWVNANLTADTGINVTNAAGSVTIANTGVTSVAGTANQVTASASTGGVTLSLPATINVDTSGNAATATTATNQSGGTVDATTGSFSGQITSTVATGTAPMVIASTTKVANLNVEQVDGYHADTANTASTLAVRDASKKLAASGVVLSGSTSGTTTLVASAAAGTTTATLPATTGTIITTGDTGTVTNTMLAGSIANAKLANSSVTVTAGTGLSGGGAIALGGSATVSLANTDVTAGSYTNSAITVDAQGRITAASSGTAPVTSVGATAPIASSGGATPTISISQASSTTNGYLSSTDWNTFNNKGSGTVTSVTGTSPVSSSGGATPAISLSNGYGDTKNPYASKTANYVLAAPNGAAGAPTFRAIVAADIPTLNQNTTGTAAGLSSTLAIASGGTGSTTASAALQALGAQAAASAITTSNIGSQSVSYATSAGSATNATTATNLSGGTISTTSIYNTGWYGYADGNRDAGNAVWYPNVAARSVRWFFATASSTGTGGNYSGVMQFDPWDGTTASTGDASYQMAFGSTAANGGGIPQLNIRKGIDTTWNSWYTLLHSGNYSSYALPLSGGTMSGTITNSASSLIIGTNGGVNRGYLYNDASGFGFLTSGGAWAAYVPYGTNNFQVNGSFTAAGNVTAYSDETLKKDWEDLPSNFVNQLAEVKHGTYTRIDSGERQVGVSAQSLLNVMEEAVIEDATGKLSVAYGNAALAACVELAKRVVSLEAEIKALKG